MGCADRCWRRRLRRAPGVGPRDVGPLHPHAQSPLHFTTSIEILHVCAHQTHHHVVPTLLPEWVDGSACPLPPHRPLATAGARAPDTDITPPDPVNKDGLRIHALFIQR